jgi:hypothetical protein
VRVGVTDRDQVREVVHLLKRADICSIGRWKSVLTGANTEEEAQALASRVRDLWLQGLLRCRLNGRRWRTDDQERRWPDSQQVHNPASVRSQPAKGPRALGSRQTRSRESPARRRLISEFARCRGPSCRATRRCLLTCASGDGQFRPVCLASSGLHTQTPCRRALGLPASERAHRCLVRASIGCSPPAD